MEVMAAKRREAAERAAEEAAAVQAAAEAQAEARRAAAIEASTRRRHAFLSTARSLALAVVPTPCMAMSAATVDMCIDSVIAATITTG